MLWAVRAWSAHCSRMSCSVSPCATKSQSMPTSLQLTTLAMLISLQFIQSLRSTSKARTRQFDRHFRLDSRADGILYRFVHVLSKPGLKTEEPHESYGTVTSEGFGLRVWTCYALSLGYNTCTFDEIPESVTAQAL